MRTARLHLILPECIADFARSGPLSSALRETARLGGADLTFEDAQGYDTMGLPCAPDAAELPIRYRGQPKGHVLYDTEDGNPSAAQAAATIVTLLEHALDREIAVTDLAAAMTTGYEELNMLHSLLAEIAFRTDPKEIAELLVDEVVRTLECRRVSLLLLDQTSENLKVLAARGLPPEVHGISISTSDSVAGRVLLRDGLLVVNDVSDYPDLVAMSRGNYDTESFAVIRVPLNARGEAVGVLAATERTGGHEFTARDCKLFEGLSSIGASALLNCRLHAAVSRQMMSTIKSLATAVDAKDHYTHDHSGRVAQLCLAVARDMGVTDPATCREVELAGLLHDIGKIGIPDSVLTKTEELTPQEYAAVKTHAQIGAKIVQEVQGLESVGKAILHHHERYDGLGYPRGIAGDAIPLTSRLISAADVFDTLTSDRPYREAIPVEKAIRELRRSSGTQLDPTVVECLIAVLNRERKPRAPASPETACVGTDRAYQSR